MEEELGGCLLLLLALGLAGALCAISHAQGKGDSHRDFIECRNLLTTADSATVVRTRPDCVKWTLPPKEAP